MMPHKFHVGESVILRPAISRKCARRGLRSDQTTPPTMGASSNIKSANEEHERVAREGELTKA
jgi:hypothetical protein